MKRKTRFLSFLLALVMVATVCSACVTPESSTDERNRGTDTAAAEETVAPVDSALNELRSVADWGGKDFGIL